MRKKFKIKAGTFDMDIRVIVCSDLKKACRYINKKMRLPAKGDRYKVVADDLIKAHAVFVSTEKYNPVIWLPFKPKKISHVCTIVHEVLHAVFDITKHHSISYSEEGEELYTYLQMHLLKQLFKKIKVKVK